MKTITKKLNSVLAAVLTMAALMVGQAAWAMSSFTVAIQASSSSSCTFRITRTGNTAVEETISWRVVSLSAIAGQHFTGDNNKYAGTVTFNATDTYVDVTIGEKTPSVDAYKYQNGDSRKYRFEVLDRDGYILSSCDRSRNYGTSVSSSGLFSEKTGTIQSDPFEVTDVGYHQTPRTINRESFYNDNDKAYLDFLDAQLRMTLEFEAKEEEDGYQYLQILFDNTTGYDSDNSAEKGNPGTLSLSKYMAGFEIYSGKKYTEYKTYSFPVTSVGHDAGAVDPWGHDPTNHKFPLDKQKFNGSRADDGKLIVPNPFNTISVRFDSSGEGNDDWWIQNLKAKITAVDGTAPTIREAYTVSGGRHQKGNTFYVSVAFSEIVKITGYKKLMTTWGDLEYEAGEGTNVLTFKGKISSSASDKLKITGLNGTIKDLAGKLFSCPWTEDTPKELSTTLSNDYVWSLSDFRFLSANTYEIASKLDLRHLAFLVNVNNNDCNGITFKQTQNITCDDTYTPIGGYIDQVNKMFGGTYDGQGHTVSDITVSRTGDTWADCYLGLFGFVGNGGIVKNVVLASSTFTGHDYVGGIVGNLSSGTVENCRVESSVSVNAGHDAAKNHGGIVGSASGSYTKVSGCVSAATVSNNDKSSSKQYGGIVGCFSDYGTVKDCLYTGTTVTAASYKGAIVGFKSNSATLTNNYYTSISLGGVGAEGSSSDKSGARLARTVTLGENIILKGSETAYSVSGLTAIGTTALRYNDGNTETLYSGTTQTLTLNYTDLADGYTAFYSVNGEAIDGNTFQMPANDVTVNCSGTFKTTYITHWQAGPAHDGSTSEKAYLITTPAGLQLLASEVNGGNKFSGKYFKLDSDIDMSSVSNFTPIGNTAQNYFSGNFDGQGNTIRHLTITQTGGTLVGLFGYLKGDNPYPVVSDLTLDGANISAGDYVGGIVGHQLYCSVSNCHVVSSSISGTATDAKVGAIAGWFSNTSNNSLSNCTYHSTLVYANSTDGKAFNIGCGLKGLSNNGGDSNGAGLDATQLFVDGGRADLATLLAAYRNPAKYTAHNGKAPDLSNITASVRGNVTIPSGSVFEAEYVNVLTGSHLTLEDGAELIFRDERSYAPVILEKKVAPYTDGNNGWNLLVTPFQEGVSLNGLSGYNPTAPAVYDLYQMSDDRTVWENSKKKSLDKTNIYNSDGILYASSVETTLKNSWEQKSYPETADGHKVYLKKSCWNVIGNPYTFTAYVNRPYYRMNADGSALELVTDYWKEPVPVCGGIVMKAIDEVVHIDDSVYFTRQAPPEPVSIADDRTVKAPLPIVLPASHGADDNLRFIYVLEEYYDNVDRIAENAGQSRFFQLRGRTLWKDGCWNTLCLPFPLTAEQIAASKLAGADIRTLSSSSYNSSTKRLTLNFTAVTSIQAGVPYIIKWTRPEPYVAYTGSNGEACSDIVSPDFPGVTVSSTYTDAAAIATSLNDTRTQTTYVDFIGTYTPAQLPDDHTKLLVGIENKLYWPQSGARIYAQRAYFQLKNGLTADEVQNASMFFDDGDATGILEVIGVSGVSEVNDDSWYDLSGRKLDQQPTQKGVYIHGGRKVVIK